MAIAALQGVVAVQLNAHHTLGGNGGLIGVAGVDVDIIQRDIGGLTFFSINGHAVAGRSAGDDGLILFPVLFRCISSVLICIFRPLAHILAVIPGTDRDVAHTDVIGGSKRRCGAGRHHGQKRCGGKHPQCRLVVLSHWNPPKSYSLTLSRSRMRLSRSAKAAATGKDASLRTL